MKRSMALSEIVLCGYDGDTSRATLIAAKHGIGKAAFNKAFQDGKKMKERKEPRPKPIGGK